MAASLECPGGNPTAEHGDSGSVRGSDDGGGFAHGAQGPSALFLQGGIPCSGTCCGHQFMLPQFVIAFFLFLGVCAFVLAQIYLKTSRSFELQNYAPHVRDLLGSFVDDFEKFRQLKAAVCPPVQTFSIVCGRTPESAQQQKIRPFIFGPFVPQPVFSCPLTHPEPQLSLVPRPFSFAVCASADGFIHWKW